MLIFHVRSLTHSLTHLLVELLIRWLPLLVQPLLNSLEGDARLGVLLLRVAVDGEERLGDLVLNIGRL